MPQYQPRQDKSYTKRFPS